MPIVSYWRDTFDRDVDTFRIQADGYFDDSLVFLSGTAVIRRERCEWIKPQPPLLKFELDRSEYNRIPSEWRGLAIPDGKCVVFESGYRVYVGDDLVELQAALGLSSTPVCTPPSL